MINIYQNSNTVKWIIVFLALLIGISTLVYTNMLVKQLTLREQMQIDFYAKALEFIVSSENSSEQNFLLTEIVEANDLIPVIWADGEKQPIDYRNIDIPNDLTTEEKNAFLKEEIIYMQKEYEPIVIHLGETGENYIYYSNSSLVMLLWYYPYIQLSIIAILSILAYLIFNFTRRAEQNRVWVGLAKETAHQLGTPISSLMAWAEYFKSDPVYDKSIIIEIEKDIQRLEMITARFSSIGSLPTLKNEDLVKVIEGIVTYLQKRVSSKVSINFTPKFGENLSAPINVPLFEWVIENICKNAVDAMSGNGKIDIYLRYAKDRKSIIMDINDTGKGIPKSKLATVFKAGYTTKKRGWGLGLTLVKRIVENYHNGKIFVKKSVPHVGTTFRIIIYKD